MLTMKNNAYNHSHQSPEQMTVARLSRLKHRQKKKKKKHGETAKNRGSAWGRNIRKFSIATFASWRVRQKNLSQNPLIPSFWNTPHGPHGPNGWKVEIPDQQKHHGFVELGGVKCMNGGRNECGLVLSSQPLIMTNTLSYWNGPVRSLPNFKMVMFHFANWKKKKTFTTG